MIKTLIILALLVVLCAGAFFSRPSQSDFNDFYAAQAAKNSSNALVGGLESAAAKQYAQQAFTFHDRGLWVDVQKDGKTAATGAFAHWFVRDQDAMKPKLAMP